MIERAYWTGNLHTWTAQSGRHEVSDAGMSTVEYAIGTIAAAAFAALLYAVVTGDSVLAGLTSLIEQALSAPV